MSRRSPTLPPPREEEPQAVVARPKSSAPPGGRSTAPPGGSSAVPSTRPEGAPRHPINLNSCLRVASHPQLALALVVVLNSRCHSPSSSTRAATRPRPQLAPPRIPLTTSSPRMLTMATQERNKEVKGYKNKVIKYWDSISLVYCKDHATGEAARTASESSKEMAKENDNHKEVIGSATSSSCLKRQRSDDSFNSLWPEKLDMIAAALKDDTPKLPSSTEVFAKLQEIEGLCKGPDFTFQRNSCHCTS